MRDNEQQVEKVRTAEQADVPTRPRFSVEEQELLGGAANIVERAAAPHLANFLRKLAIASTRPPKTVVQLRYVLLEPRYSDEWRLSEARRLAAEAEIDRLLRANDGTTNTSLSGDVGDDPADDWPGSLVVERRGRLYTIIDGTQATDFSRCNLYVLARESGDVEERGEAHG